jgi:magnesium-transporting ATPase (P-type)
MLVSGDVIAVKLGDIVPTDCCLTGAINVSINQDALTGDQCFS